MLFDLVSALETVMTTLHAGGKFGGESYKVSGGLHGVGVSCVNALSQEFNVEIWRDDHTWEMDFSCGDPISELRQAGTSKRRGTKIHFLPDKSIFAATEFNYDTLAQRLREMAFLNKGLEICKGDERLITNRNLLQNGKALKMKVYGEQWYQFLLERPMIRQEAPSFARVSRRALRG